ncbi:MAG TPA: rhodanese [Thiolapillus brandeum]|uniref:Rhodanese n=1 Tax=Thiolapillus brandeum TaxID=1076588 RepID=A0A831JY79_9GAMM|nr:rhodanese [Thiolapillus brandeum]
MARRETKTGHGYHGFSVEIGPDVTLEQDLSRRDLTINAMAEDEQGNIIDPFGGQEDLKNGILCHVTPAFVEDPVRLLRIARFAARFGNWGFHVAHGTHALLKKMVASGELEHLQGQRIWQEMRKALMDKQPWRFFQVLQACGALQQLFPTLAAVWSASAGHGDEQDSEPMSVLKRAVADGLELPLRFVCVMQYAVDAQHNPVQLTRHLGIDRKISVLLVDWLQARSLLMRLPEGNAGDYYQYLRQFRKSLPEFRRLAQVCMPELAASVLPLLEKAHIAMHRVDAKQLQEQGWQGKALGEELARRQQQAVASVLGEIRELR